MTMQDVKNHIRLSTNHGMRNLTEWSKNFVENNKTISPDAKTVRAIVNYHKYQYENGRKIMTTLSNLKTDKAFTTNGKG